MLVMLLRKMLSNRWLVLSLLAGIVLAIAMVAGIPIYTAGVLERMLVRDLELFQSSRHLYPGHYEVSFELLSYYTEEERRRLYRIMADELSPERLQAALGLPIVSHCHNLIREYVTVLPDAGEASAADGKVITLEALSGLEEHITILQGRMFNQEQRNRGDERVHEVIVTEEAVKYLDLYLGKTYVAPEFGEHGPNRLEIVGVFTVKDARDPYWFQPRFEYPISFFMEYASFRAEFTEGALPLILKSRWYRAFDYRDLTLEHVRRTIAAYERQEKWLGQYAFTEINVPAIPTLKEYLERERRLETMLWVLQLPILLMLTFYMFMVSGLIAHHDRNEIAILKSRGGSGGQVLLSYLGESLLLSGVAILLGPPLALVLCRILGFSNGFLEFVMRTSLSLSLTPDAYLYAAGVILLFIVAVIVPARLYSRHTIVGHKQSLARRQTTPLWKKAFLDLLLLALSLYGLYRYRARQEILTATGIEGLELAIDPLLYVISVLFALGAGLCFLRIYPFAVKLVFLAGKRLWSPLLYAALIGVSRSGERGGFLMLFLILTLSTGIFNAGAARTLNVNTEEKIKYAMGTDIRLKAYWESNRLPLTAQGIADGQSAGSSPAGGPYPMSPYAGEAVIYQEPPFWVYENLDGVEKVTKVFRRYDAEVQTPQAEWVRNVYLMGITPSEFGRVAWFRSDLLPYHWFQYLNLLAMHPKAVLVSRSFAEKHKIQTGDALGLTWQGQGFLEVSVYAFLDYWPTYNPREDTEGAEGQSLIVANLSYIQAKMALEPYEVWIKKRKGATSELIYAQIQAAGLEIEKLEDSALAIVSAKNDPLLQGTNGALSLGFLVSMTISLIGFLIYWTISIRERALQFGVFRAIGLSQPKIFRLLLYEQILVSGMAMAAGIAIGSVTSRLFVPLLQIVYSAAQQVPPFKVVAYAGDFAKIILVAAFMLGAGLSVLGAMTARIKIYQALKLGEQ